MSDDAKEKSKIEAIYPLSTMQQGILFHHLTAKNDEGFLNVQCSIDGDLNVKVLKASWDLAIKRHPVLRTSVHWEKIKKPIQLVKPSAIANWTVLDWTKEAEDIQEQKLKSFKDNNKKDGLNFQKKPLSKVSLIKIKKDSFYLVWCCHHLLLDGWSSSIILKDVFAYYNSLIHKKEVTLEPISSYKSYLNWLKETDLDEAKNFWIETFKGFKNPFLFNQNQSKLHETVKNHLNLSIDTSKKAESLAKANQVTLNTLFQGIWALVISKYSNSFDITYGNTVSGRSGSFPNIELMAGMFANVLPVRMVIDNHISIKDWLKNIQLQQIKSRAYEQFTTSEITEWIDTASENIFDSLFIFENFPWDDINAGDIRVHSSYSGITTTYPLTLTIKTAPAIEIYLFSDSAIFSNNTNQWILNRFEDIINLLDSDDSMAFDTLLNNIKPVTLETPNTSLENSKSKNIIVNPTNKTELELLKIWERLLNQNNISISDNFFEIGGKSLLAIKLFSKINSQFKTNLSATTLLEHATIAELSQLILDGKDVKTWDYIVPIRSKGTKNPLFCIHGGGGYVIFFNPLVNALNKNIPVYALQPAGLGSTKEMHNSIENMAKDYAKEIKDAQPKGPYNLLTYCFSPAVGIEIANIFKAEGEETNLIVIDSIIKQEDFASPERVKMRIYGFLNRVLKNPFSALKLMISNNYARFIRPKMIALFADAGKKNLEKITQNLVKIYVNYGWNKKHTDNVLLILTHKADKNLNPIYVESWEGITDGQVKVVYTSGDHLELFDPPHVESVANHIEKDIYNL